MLSSDALSYTLYTVNTYNSDYSNNTISTSQWSSLEQYGAVFLPVVGYRLGSVVEGVNSYGYYWSATLKFYEEVYFLSFSPSGLNAYGYGNREVGRAVRLVQDY